MDISGNPVPPTRPDTPLPKLVEGIRTIGDLFKRMESNTTLESFVDAGCAATGVGIETKPLLEADMDLPTPATREDNIMTLKQQFASLAKFKDVPMTYAEMRARYG